MPQSQTSKFKEFKPRILDAIALSANSLDDNSNSGWYRIAYEGKWEGHWMGAFALDQAVFDQILASFSARKTEVPLDYDHASLFSMSAPAAGWVNQLESRRDEMGLSLWASIAWTPRAAEAIRALEYRYLSPTLFFNTKDPETGLLKNVAALNSVALTNQPFLKNNSEVRLNSLLGSFVENDNFTGDNMNPEQLIALAALFGLAKEATFDQVKARAEQVILQAKAHVVALAELGLPAAATQEQMVGAILQLKNPANQISLAEFNALKAEAVERRALDAVKGAQAEGKITADGTEQFKWALSYAAKDPEGFKAWSLSAPKLVPVAPAQHSPDAQKGTRALSDEEKEVCRQLNITEEQYRKHNNIPEAK